MASIKQYRGKKWRAIVRRVGFSPQSKTFDFKKDAELWAATVEARLGVSEHDPLQMKQARVTTVRSLFERYRDEVGVNMKGRNEVGTLNRLIRDAVFMGMRLDKLSPRHIRDWRDDAAAQGIPAADIEAATEQATTLFEQIATGQAEAVKADSSTGSEGGEKEGE